MSRLSQSVNNIQGSQLFQGSHLFFQKAYKHLRTYFKKLFKDHIKVF